jgi:outer membrane protein OmpA-like peptidoglycan-associated protein
MSYDTSDLVSTSDLAAASVKASRDRRHRPARTAYAAPLSASEDACMGSRSFGVQGAGFGFSIATTWSDRTCRRLKNARQLEALGYPEAATQLLCMDREVREAMARANTPCTSVRRVQTIAPMHPAPLEEPVTDDTLLARYTVLFDFDSARLKHGAGIILEPLLAMLQADRALHVDVEGNADWVGSDAYNLRLSRRRAQAVVEWLVAHGIARERLNAVGYGERQPIASNRTAEGRAQNRRVEVHRRT